MPSEIAREYPLDYRGLAFVRAHLAGVNTLGDELLKLLDSAPGETFTFAPYGPSEERLYRFGEGGLLATNLDFSRAVSLGPGRGTAMQVDDLRDEQASVLLATAAVQSRLVIVIDEVIAKWEDPHVHDLPGALHVKDEVYRVLSPRVSRSTLATALRGADAIWHGVALVALDHEQLTPSLPCSPATLASVAAGAILVTCSAYDGEGFVGWRRRQAAAT
jgi:hypothetical protein